MHKVRILKEKENISIRIEEDNNYTRKFNRGVQHQKLRWLEALCDTIKWANICITGVPEGEERKGGGKLIQRNHRKKTYTLGNETKNHTRKPKE